MLARLVALALLLSASASATPQGDLGLHPGTGTGFFKEANQGGRASELHLLEVSWGRPVNVYDINGALRFEDLVIGPDIASDGVNFALTKNAITQQDALTILHPFKSRPFRQALLLTQAGLVPLLDKGVGPGVLPPFTMVARNGALSLRFDDLLDDGGEAYSPGWPGTVTPQTVRLLSTLPFPVQVGALVRPDPNHGALLGDEFHSTRVVISFTRSQFQAFNLGGQVNPVGLPGSTTTTLSNAIVRIATQANAVPFQPEILTNLIGNGLSFTGNGSNDPAPPTQDIVRTFRSGGETAVTGDPFNGFLPDDIPPVVLGEQSVIITEVQTIGDTLALDLQFQTLACAWAPRIGDVIETALHAYEVLADGAPPVNGSVQNVRVRKLYGLQVPAPTIGKYTTTWDPGSGSPAGCFVTFTPPPLTLPTSGVDQNADVQLRFNEPMQAGSVDPFDAFSIHYDLNPAGGNPLYDRVVGSVAPSVDLSRFSFQPTLPLADDGNGSTADTYTIKTQAGALGPRDLVGNPLAIPLTPVQFSRASSYPSTNSKGLVLGFGSVDEDGNGAPEIRGQFLYDFATETLRPRPVTRFSAQADRVQHPTTASMVPLQAPVQTPLSNLGSKMMAVWRYHDLGLGLLDEWTHNLDVEGLWWEPFGGNLMQDSFDEFRMSLSHSEYLPDEGISASLLPVFPTSGLDNTFAANRADTAAIVHQKSKGYVVSPLDLIQSPTGQPLAPWPMNRNVAVKFFQRWTWRDTGTTTVAAPNNAGVDTWRYLQVSPPGVAGLGFYPTNEVPTIGLPLLMEFRTYASPASSGLNAFQVAVAINSSARPYFRTFSTGGVLSNGQVLVVDPDQETTGSGGVNPLSGTKTASRDNAFYYGQADFVVRISRLHTIWLDTLGTSTFSAATLIPAPFEQPAGTQVFTSYRGASSLTSQTPDAWEDAANLDPYGNSYTAAQHCRLNDGTSNCTNGNVPPNFGQLLEFTPTFFPNPQSSGWTSDITDLDGARFVQVRITMIANPDTGQTPEVSAIGLAFLQ